VRIVLQPWGNPACSLQASRSSGEDSPNPAEIDWPDRGQAMAFGFIVDSFFVDLF
jgi:hypothetical protein